MKEDVKTETKEPLAVDLKHGVRPACEFCNDTGEKVDHIVEGAPAAVMVFCDCPAGDAVREIFDEVKGTK